METSEFHNTGELIEWLDVVLRHERNATAHNHKLILDKLSSFFHEPSQKSVASALASCGESHTIITANLENIVVSTEEEAEEAQTLRRIRKSELSQKLSTEDWGSTPLWHPYRLVRTTGFEIFWAVMILASSVLIAVQCQYQGLKTGYDLGYNGHHVRAETVWPGAVAVFDTMEFIFGVLFTIEATLKILGLGWQYPRSAWNLFDAALVLFWLVDISMTQTPVDGSLLRLVRLARLMRLVRLARTVHGFDSLVVMTTALQHSVSALLWVAVLLSLMQMLFALMINQLLAFYLQDQGIDAEERQLVFEYYGTFSRAMLTMFEMTLGNWGPPARVLQEHVSGFWVIFSVLHKVTLGFACIQVVNGVFMHQTFSVAHSDDAVLMREADLKKRMHMKKMKDFFYHTDDDGDFTISFDEWTKCLENDAVHHWFSGQGLSLSDADRLFQLLDTDKDGSLTHTELAQGVARLQGAANSLDLILVHEDLQALCGGVQDELKELRAQIKQAVILQGRPSDEAASKFGTWSGEAVPNHSIPLIQDALVELRTGMTQLRQDCLGAKRERSDVITPI